MSESWVPPEQARLEYLDKLTTLMRDRGVRRMKCGDLEVELTPMREPSASITLPRAGRLPTAGVLAEAFAPSPEEQGAV